MTGGVAVQWAPAPRARDAFVSAFPHVVQLDRFIMLSSDTPILVEAVALAVPRPVFWKPGMARPAGDLNDDLFPRDEFSLNR
jgi:hypothetical protein